MSTRKDRSGDRPIGEVFVWDAQTYEIAFSLREDDYSIIEHLWSRFSPDSSRLGVTASRRDTVAVWEVATRQPLLTLDDLDWVREAKYSPQGDRIVTTNESARVWDSNDGRLLVGIPFKLGPVDEEMFDAGLLGWSNNHLFVISASKIKEFEASRNSQFTTTVTRASASPFQSMGNPPHIPSHIGTDVDTCRDMTSPG